MTIPLADWNESVRVLFGWSLIGHPARLRDGVDAACRARATTEDALFEAVRRGERGAVEALARSLTVGETYFFREPHHFDLVRKLLPLRVAAAARSRKIQLVSAACASGEEAYSLAIVAREVLGNDADQLVHVLGVDVNDASLAQAARATYRPWSLRGVPAEVKRTWFEDTPAGARLVKRARSLVSFAHENLASPLVGDDSALAPGSADFLFCRNALLYFDPAAATEALHRMAKALTRDGILVVGTAEAGFLVSAGLSTQTIDGVTVHAPSSPSEPPRVPRPASSAPPAAEARPRARPPRARALRPRTADVAPPSGGDQALDAEGFAVRGFRSLPEDPTSAAADARRALLLDRKLVAGHVLTAAAAVALGTPDGARAALARARRLLSSTPDCSMVPATGATKEEMLAYCSRLLRALPAS